MKKEDLKIDENTVVHCPTKELANEVLTIADRLGYCWVDSNSFLNYNHWYSYEKDTCYNLGKGLIFDIDFYTTEGYKIISAEEFINLHRNNMEQRTVKLDLNTAKEWYNKGGELREVALQAFTEEELKKQVKTWEDLENVEGFYIDSMSSIYHYMKFSPIPTNRNTFLTEKQVKSALAMAQISQLMPYYGGAITNKEWDDNAVNKYTIGRINNNIITESRNFTYFFLAFHTEKQRDEFLKYNGRLVKDYYMMD